MRTWRIALIPAFFIGPWHACPLIAAEDASTRVPEGQTSAVSHGPGEGATTTADSPAATKQLPDAQVGYAGHFSCRTFSGVDRDLCVAASDERPDEVRRLIAAGANIEARSDTSHTKGMTILQVAVWHRWTYEAIELLIRAGADVNARDNRGNTALVLATQSWPVLNPRLVDLFVHAGAYVNAAGENCMTPLMHAVMHDETTQAVQTLLAAGARVSARDNTGWTALMHATRRKHESAPIIELLITAGASVNAAHKYGGTALSVAAFGGRAQDAELLIDAGARVNARDASGLTPLICAALGGHTHTAMLLIRAGANVGFKDRFGRTALDIARLNADTEMESVLLRPSRHRSHAYCRRAQRRR
jgi:ankyrin repeat protein